MSPFELLGDLPPLDLTQRLLAQLTDQPQTTEELGARLKTSPQNIEATVQILKMQGVPVTATPPGYALASGTPAAQLVKASGLLGQARRYAGTVGSTQDEIRRWADESQDPAPHGAVYVAERQTAGRGRRGRVWDTTHGTLVFSILLRPQHHQPLSVAYLSALPLAVGVALRQAVEVGGLKWPNDLLAADGRKLAGILLEADLRGEQARRAVLGIGINVSSAPAGAAHLNEFGTEKSRAEVLSSVLSALNYWLAQPAAEVFRAWRSYSVTLGQPVQVHTDNGPVVGTALDLDEKGNLLVSTQAGQLHTVRGGDVQLIGTLKSTT